MNDASRTDAPSTSPLPPMLISAPSSAWPYALVGVLQGIGLWLQQQSTASGTYKVALVYGLIAGPLAWYLSSGGFRKLAHRLTLAIGVGVVYALLGAHAADAHSWRTLNVDPGLALAAVVMGFVLVPLVTGFDAERRRFSYTRLFEMAWRNAVLLPAAAALTGLLWMLLWAGAWLMESIGLSGLRELLRQEFVGYTLTCGGYGLSVGLALARSEAMLTFRRFWLSITTWFAPLALALSVVWVAALPFTGVNVLLRTGHAASYILWFCALATTFLNAAFQDGREHPALPGWLARAVAWAWLTMPVLAVLAAWALAQRVAQHGWTPDRIWAALVTLLALVHALGYALSQVKRGVWLGTLPITNITAALIEVTVIALLISPVADVRRLAVNDQLARLKSGAADAAEFDWSFFQRDTGPYGREALLALSTSAGSDAKTRELAEHASRARAGEPSRGGRRSHDPQALAGKLRTQLTFLPAGTQPDESLLAWMARPESDWDIDRCAHSPQQCLIWMVDLNHDGQPEAVVLFEQDRSVSALVLSREARDWAKQGDLLDGPHSLAEWTQLIQAAPTQLVPPKWSDVMLGGQRVTFDPR